jgi:segregation and condensation protein A
MDQTERSNTSYVVKVDNFEGPFDLLLYLVRNSKISIHDLHISDITSQFIETMRTSRLNLEAISEFIFTAAHLLYLKSRILLPEDIKSIDDEPDERREYIDNLIEYQKYRNASKVLKEGLERNKVLMRSDSQLIIDFEDSENWEEVSIIDLVMAFARVAKEVDKSAFKSVELEEISIEDRIDDILNQLIESTQLMFDALFPAAFTKYELIITFLALLELVKMKKIYILQHKLFGSIKIVRREDQ